MNYFVPEPQIVNAKDFGVLKQEKNLYRWFHGKTWILLNLNIPKPTNTDVKFADVKEEIVPATKYFLSTQYVQDFNKSRKATRKQG